MYNNQLKAISEEKILINNKPTHKDYLVRNGDLLIHKTIRRELPVYAGSLNIVFEDEDLLVVDKPPSMPVHPCGAYHHNSVVNILKAENGFDKLMSSIKRCSST
jgi:23S rRNA-/tRNA-specific pseudouridylate synthase